MTEPEFRSGFICFVGRPNTGKSTLTNALVGDKIAITVVKLSGGAVRLGVEAPAEQPVMREELALEIEEAQKAALDGTANQ